MADPHLSRSILLVDDDAYLLAALVRAFRKYPDWKVLTANSSDAALRLMTEQPVQAVISDMRMPHMNGKELLERVGDLYPTVFRLMLTGSTSGEIVPSDFQVVYKPCKIEVLLSKIESGMQLQQKSEPMTPGPVAPGQQ